MIINRNWIRVNNATIAIDSIDAYVAGDTGGTEVFLRGGQTIRVWEYTPREFEALLVSTNA